ncbi:MAG: hypothetical protein C0467_23180 [Planctomycetaceae bacterium]|nr:hypothetical protein [Planctomycetaceae bacterium]
MTRKAAKTDSKRTSPLIWVKQVTLYKSISPVEEIRTIHFTPGLNIVQGKSDDSALDFESGHGNGKTTLCRLIRYCLGEKTFGQQHVVAEVKHCFPNGYIGAVIVVDGEEWAVLRTLGTHRKEYAQQGGNLTELAKASGRQSYSEFVKRIQEVGLSRLKQREVLSGGEAIQWLHVLALCSRDQESRYDRFWNVRPTRSDSGLSKFTKADVSLCVRAMLGILDIREPQILKRLDALESDLKQLRVKIADKAGEPAFHIAQLRTRLLNDYGVAQADTASLIEGELYGLPQMRDTRLSNLRDEAKEIEGKIADLDTQINGATARLNEIHEEQETKVTAKEVTATGSAVLEQSTSPESQRQTILEKMDRLCPSGELARNCDKVKERLAELDDQIAKSKPTDSQRQALKTVQKRDQVEAGLGDEAKRPGNELEQIRARLKQLNDEKNTFLVRRGLVSEWMRLIPQVTNNLLRWSRIEQGEEPNQELTTLRSQEKQNVDEAEQLKQELTELLAKQNERVQQFRERFHGLVQRAINTTFKGVVAVEREEIAFRISRERSLSGEAYETLSVLLADIAILMESFSETVCHPGLLIHDSPREADLNVRLYERMLETAFSLMSDGLGETPYQYIVTTTTQPAESLRSAKVTKEVLSGGSGSLFRMQLEMSQNDAEESTLFENDADF